MPTIKNILYTIPEERRTEPVKIIHAIVIVRISGLLLSGGAAVRIRIKACFESNGGPGEKGAAFLYV